MMGDPPSRNSESAKSSGYHLAFCAGALAKLKSVLAAEREPSAHNGPDEATAEATSEQDQQLLALMHARDSAGKGLSDREQVCEDLANALWARWKQCNDETALAACIAIEAEIVSLHHPDHPKRALRCANLAISLKACASQAADHRLLDNAIDLEREVLALQPRGHEDRVTACVNLSLSLWKRFEDTDNDALLNEVIELEREILESTLSDNAERATLCMNLACSLQARFNRTRTHAALQEVIGLQQEALALRPVGHTDRAASCQALGNSLHSYYELTGQGALLNTGIELLQEAMSLRPPGHPDRGSSCSCLATLLLTCSEIYKDSELLGDAIDHLRKALNLHPHEHPSRALTCNNLADALCERFKQTRDIMTLDEVIELQQEALNLQPADDPDQALYCACLAISLKERFDQIQDNASLDEAIELERRVLELQPVGHEERAPSCILLSKSLYRRVAQTGERTTLDEALHFARESLDLQPIGHPGRSNTCSSVATLLHKCWNLTGDRGLLGEAMTLRREALSLQPTEDPGRALFCSNLSDDLSRQYDQTGDNVLLDEAIQLGREALDLQPTGGEHRDAACAALAGALYRRYLRSGDNTLIIEVARLEREVLNLRPVGHASRAVACAHLAGSLSECFQQTAEVQLLLEATNLMDEAMDLRPPGHPHRAWTCGKFAGLLVSRFEHCPDIALINEAIDLHREVLALQPKEHVDRAYTCVTLANSLFRRLYLVGEHRESTSLDKVSHLLREGLALFPQGHPDRWGCLTQLAEIDALLQNWTAAIATLHTVVDRPAEDDIDHFLSEIVQITNLMDANSMSHEQRMRLLMLFEKALGLVTLATGLAIDTSTRLRHIHEGSSMGLQAFVLAAQVGDLAIGVQLLEHARGVLWSQALHLRHPDLARIPLKQAEKLEAILRKINIEVQPSRADTHMPSMPPSLLLECDSKYSQQSQLQQVLREIRSLPELGDFMRGPDPAALINTAVQNPVVILIAGKGSLSALIIASSHSPLVNLHFDDFSTQALQDFTYAGWSSQHRGSCTDHADGKRFMAGVSQGMLQSHARLAKLWRSVVKPIMKQLSFEKQRGRQRPRIYWCLTGAFAFVPVHAAGIYQGPNQECCADYVVSSYTPTLSALLRAQKTTRSFSAEETQLLAVAAEHVPGLPSLPCVKEEIRHITEVARTAKLAYNPDEGRMAKIDIIASLKSANIVHLACHGTQHNGEPHKSRFFLSSGSLSVSELMELDLKDAFFAFLSACETAKGDQKHADEVVHLAATMLFAVFKSVVATMWAMRDADGPFVARRFYEELFKNETIDADTIPYALDEAVSDLRSTGALPERWAAFIHMGA